MRDRDESPIRLRRHQDCQAWRRLRFEARADEAGTCARDRQRVEKFGLVEKADVGGDRDVERGDITDTPVERIARSRLGARERRDSQRALDDRGCSRCSARSETRRCQKKSVAITPYRRIRYNGRMNGDMHRDWIPYPVAGVIAVAVAVGFWFFAMWLGG